jgi:hypothetical protein
MDSNGFSKDNTHIGDVEVIGDMNITGDLDAGALVFDEAKLAGDLDCNGNNILNCADLQASTFNGGTVLTNPLSSDLDCSSNNINNCSQIQNTGDISLIASNNAITTAFNEVKLSVGFSSKLNISGTITSLLNNTIQCNNENVLGVNEIHTDTLTSNQNAVIQSNVNLDMTNNSINGANSVDTLNLGHIINPAIPMNLTTDMTCGLNDIKSINRLELKTLSGNGGSTFIIDSNADFKSNTISDVSFLDVLALGNTSGAIPMTITTDTQFNFRDLTQINSIDTNSLTTPNINGRPALNVSATDLTNLLTTHRTYQQSLEMGTTLPQTKTIHIFEASAFGGTVNVGGFNYHPLIPDTAYIIHGEITLTAGFLIQNNCSLKGATIASKIIFDESTSDIIGFKSTDHNVYLDSLTISGGGGHFSNTPIGLFDCLNFNTTIGTPPFYGRNKRFRVINCNILSPYSLGAVRGYGTLNFNSNFINGGGGSPSGVYTTYGLFVQDGLSLEFNNNKIVLWRGAQASSSAVMITFDNSDPLLQQINAVNISGNIFHPRDQESAIEFKNGSKTGLGLIASNTFIRTGGTAPLILYQRSDTFPNYNVLPLINYEILANAGVVDAQGVLMATTGAHNSLNSASYTDLSIPITSINPLTKTKRFAYKFIVNGVVNGPYTAGNYLVSVSNPSIYGYIVGQQTILAGTEILYITDMTGTFPNLTNYKEQDSTLTDTGTTSSGLQIGDNSGNIELYYFDKDPLDIQFGIQINYENTSADDEIQFRLEIDTGSGYSAIPNSTLSTSAGRANRATSATLNIIERLERGNLIKLVYRYIDTTTTTIQSIVYTGK